LAGAKFSTTKFWRFVESSFVVLSWYALKTSLHAYEDHTLFLTLASSIPCVIDWQKASQHELANQRPSNDTLDKWTFSCVTHVKPFDRPTANVTGCSRARQRGRDSTFWFRDLTGLSTNQLVWCSRQLVQLSPNHPNPRKWTVICPNMEISSKLAGAVIELDRLTAIAANCTCDGHLISLHSPLCGARYPGNARPN